MLARESTATRMPSSKMKEQVVVPWKNRSWCRSGPGSGEDAIAVTIRAPSIRVPGQQKGVMSHLSTCHDPATYKD
jgi:hypothetical protein